MMVGKLKSRTRSYYQLVPPDIHCCNLAECAIQTFKACFLSILAGISKSFPNYLWDKLLPQTELTINLLCQSHIAPAMSAGSSTTTTSHSTSMRHQSAHAAALSSFTTSPTNVHPGPSVDAMASTSVPPYHTTAASKS
jgi:hypothetical protein